MKTSKSHKSLAELKAFKKVLTQPAPPPVVEPAERVHRPESLRFSLAPKSTQKKGLDAEDKALFYEAIRGVTPLKTKGSRHTASPSKPSLGSAEQRLQRQRHASGQEELLEVYGLSDEYSYLGAQPIDEYLHPHCGTDVLRYLKKGRWPIANHIDLHGSTLEQARLRLNYFLKHSLVEQYKCVRIVHGKGYGSKGHGPVLPLAVRRWLSQLDFVLAFCDCSPSEGGSGAVKVILRTTHLT